MINGMITFTDEEGCHSDDYNPNTVSGKLISLTKMCHVESFTSN